MLDAMIDKISKQRDTKNYYETILEALMQNLELCRQRCASLIEQFRLIKAKLIEQMTISSILMIYDRHTRTDECRICKSRLAELQTRFY